MADITSPRLILAKGLLFLATALLASALLIAEHPTAKVVLLLAVAVWASARFYYFAFYVIERYVEPGCKVSGLWSAGRYLWARRRRAAGGRTAAEDPATVLPRGAGRDRPSVDP